MIEFGENDVVLNSSSFGDIPFNFNANTPLAVSVSNTC